MNAEVSTEVMCVIASASLSVSCIHPLTHARTMPPSLSANGKERLEAFTHVVVGTRRAPLAVTGVATADGVLSLTGAGPRVADKPELGDVDGDTSGCTHLPRNPR